MCIHVTSAQGYELGRHVLGQVYKYDYTWMSVANTCMILVTTTYIVKS